MPFDRPRVPGAQRRRPRRRQPTASPSAAHSVRTAAQGRADAVLSASTDRQGRFGLLLDPGTTQRVVADPPPGVPDAVRTGKPVAVPGDDGDVEVEVVLDRPAPASYDVVPIDVSVEGRPATAAAFR